MWEASLLDGMAGRLRSSGMGSGMGAGNAGSTASPPSGMGAMGRDATGSMSPEMQSRMQAHMRAMQDLRARMGAATTPEQKQSLMDEHMRLMDEDMSLMQMMMGRGTPMPGSGGPGAAGMGSPSMPGGTGGQSMPGGMGGPGSVR
jgi:hypothetical protein